MVLKPMMAIGTAKMTSDGRPRGSGGMMPSSGFLLGSGDGLSRPDPIDESGIDGSGLDESGDGPGREAGSSAQRASLDPPPRNAAATSSAARYRHAALARTVVAEVVPRLVLAHREATEADNAPSAAAAGRSGGATRVRVRAKDVVTFADRLLADDATAAEAVVTTLRSRGAGLEQVCLDLMTPAARRMGQAWLDDRNDYTDVTLGMWRMQRILRNLDPVFQPQADVPRGVPRRACITAVPGATHTFGTDMVAGFLRLAGWEVCNEPMASAKDLTDLVRGGRFTVVGLSAGCAADLGVLADLIGTLRRASGRRRPLGVMIGGSVLVDGQQRRIALRIGADAVAADAMGAVQQAEGLLALLVKPA